MKNRRQFLKESALAGIGLSLGTSISNAKFFPGVENEFRIGIIGLDTSHSPAFTKYINDPSNEKMKGLKVTAAYPYGSTRIESSATRIPGYIREMEILGIEITDDLDKLIKKSDGLLLETNDGNLHYEQSLAVMKAGKPLFIDKPVAGNLADVIRIFEANKNYKVPMFSSSSLRYLSGAQEIRYRQPIGEITGAETYSPEHWEPSHTDLYWYGIHGVEILYTIMGQGCKRLKRILTNTTDLVIGEWEGGRLGTFRGDLQGRQYYGGKAFGTKGVKDAGNSEGYGPLIDRIAEFFRTGISPVEDAETLEIYTFMEAADESKKQNGDWVELQTIQETVIKK